MTVHSLESRPRRLERTRTPAEPMRALILQASLDEDVAPRIAAAVEASTYRPGCPLLNLRAADRPAHRESRIGRNP